MVTKWRYFQGHSKCIHKGNQQISPVVFSLAMVDTTNRHDVQSMQVFSVGTSEGIGIHSIRIHQ